MPRVKPLQVGTLSGATLHLLPVPLPRMPSASPDDWLRFQGSHVPGTEMSLSTIGSVQAYMVWHRTEALTDGRQCYTVAGNRLAICEPSAIC